MPKFQEFPGNINIENQYHQWSAILDETLENARKNSRLNVVIAMNKSGLANISLITDEQGTSIHLVDAKSMDKVPILDVVSQDKYPDILIHKNEFTLQTIMLKLAEYLKDNKDLNNIKITAYKNATGYKKNDSIAVFDQEQSNLNNAA